MIMFPFILSIALQKLSMAFLGFCFVHFD